MSSTFKGLLRYCENPLFLAGLFLRLVLIAVVLPLPVEQWYVPFLSNSINHFSLDPWSAWISGGGNMIAFPYGYAMWFFLLPFALICKFLAISQVYGYGLSLIAADIGLLLILRKLLKCKDWVLLLIFWLSPISLIASYWLGHNDIIPVFFLMGAIYLLKDQRLLFSGIVLVAAISAKLSMVLGLPFFIIYLFNNRNLRQIFGRFLAGISIGSLAFFMPFLFSDAGLDMLISNPEMDKIYQLSINLARNTEIYLVPLAYLVMLYVAWRIKRINFELFNVILGAAFLLVVLLTSASLGWFIWILPLLVYYQVSGDRAAVYITSIFTVLYIMTAVFFMGTKHAEYLNQGIWFMQLSSHRLASITHTVLVATGILLAMRIWRETVIRNDFFRLSRKPFVIGVAGDSGAGKDTFVNAIEGLFGRHSVAAISGDNYHLWDRNQPMWQVMTHINPAANNLEVFARHLVSLTDGKSIKASRYDHKIGKMGKPFTVVSNDIVIASGLHALYLPILRECYDLSIYLDIDEDLRTHFKVQRDVNTRGYTKDHAINLLRMRKPDSEKFIKPQSAFADLIFSLRPINSKALVEIEEGALPRLKLIAKSRHGFNEISLKRVLISICGLHVDMSINDDVSEVELAIEGETSAEDIQMAARLICPQIFEFLDLNPRWQNGALGLMQLITLSHIYQALTRRFI